MTLKEKIRVIERLEEVGWNIQAEARIAQDALAREKRRHETELLAIVERFELEAWRHVETKWSQDEIQAARELR